MTNRCSETMVPTQGLRMHYHRCTFKGKVERDGKWYCKKHDPVAIKEKRQAESAKWKKEWEIKKAKGTCQEIKLRVADAAIEYVNVFGDKESELMDKSELLDKAVANYEIALAKLKALESDGVDDE